MASPPPAITSSATVAAAAMLQPCECVGETACHSHRPVNCWRDGWVVTRLTLCIGHGKARAPPPNGSFIGFPGVCTYRVFVTWIAVKQYCCVMLLQQKIVKYKYGGYMEYVYAVVWWVQVNSSSLREALSEGRACRSRGQSCNSGRSSQVIAL